MDKWMVDPILNANQAVATWHAKAQRCGFKFLVVQIIGQLTGGPQRYTGRSMEEAHKHLNITEAEWGCFMEIFNNVCEEFQLSADIIGDLNAGSIGWIDWNLLLDENGGPNHVDNVCDAAIVADVTAGKLFRHPQYHYIGHFSKYIPPGSRHLRTKVTPKRAYVGKTREYGTCTGQDGLEVVSFLRPDGLIAIVVLNCGDYIIAFKIREGSRATLARIPPHGIQTYLLESS